MHLTRTILVVDLGTTGIKCLAYRCDPHLRLVTSSSTRQTNPRSVKGIVDAIEACMDEVQGAVERVDIVGFSSFGMSLVGLDEEGEVKAFGTYRGELVFEDEVVNLADAVGPQSLFMELDPSVVGVPKANHFSYAAAHMMHPKSRVRVVRWTSIISYLLERWTASSGLPVSLSEASWWGLLDWRKGTWAATIRTPGGNNSLPLLADYDGLSAKLSAIHARRWPVARDAKLLLGIVDGAAATLGAAPPSELCVTIGTSAAVRSLRIRREVESNDMVTKGCFVHVLDRNRVIIGGALTDGGFAVDLTSRLVSASIRHEAIFPGDIPGNIVCLPFFSPSGERAPGWAGRNIPASFVGITSDTTPRQLIISAVVGVSLHLGEIASRFAQRSSPRFRAFISGSALAKSELWRLCIAGGLQCELWSCDLDREMDRDDASARGVAMLALGMEVDVLNCHRVQDMLELSQLQQFGKLGKAQRQVYNGLINSFL